MKQCRVCREFKRLEDFCKSAGMRDGRRHDCKACNLAAKKRRYDADPAPFVARARAWQQRHPDRHDAYQREYRSRPERKRAMRDA